MTHIARSTLFYIEGPHKHFMTSVIFYAIIFQGTVQKLYINFLDCDSVPKVKCLPFNMRRRKALMMSLQR